MPTLLLAEHDNGRLKRRRPRKALTAAAAARRRRSTCWSPAIISQSRRPTPRPSSTACGKVLLADDADLRAHARRADGGADRLARRRYDAILAAASDLAQERHAAGRGAARRDADFRDHQGGRRRIPSSGRSMPATRSRRCARPTPRRSSRCAPPRSQATGEGGARADRAGGGGGRSRPVALRRRGARQVRPAGTDLGQDHHLRRPRDAEGGELQALYRAGRRQARRGDRRLARGGRRRLCAQRLAGRADRQGGRARPLHRGRHFRRDPASGRDEGLESDRRDQQGRGGADLPGRRLRAGRRPVSRRCPNWPQELGKIGR